jgi:hypothetical protein
MPELKLDFKKLGAIRLMPLDTTDMFLPFGRPIADYVRGLAGNQNGTRALLKQGSIEFLPRIRWTESTARMLRTTGFTEVEREGSVESAVASAAELPEPADPGAADFLPFEFPWATAKGSGQAKISPAIAPGDFPIAKPRIAALPLRPRMTFGPPPAAKAKPAPVPAPAPKPAVVAPPKPTQPPAAKPVAPAAPIKVSAPAASQPKPVIVIPPAPKPSIVPATRAALPQTSSPVAGAPATRTPESAPVSTPRPMAAPVSPKISTPAAPTARAPEPTPKPIPEPSKPAPVPIASPRPESAVAAPPPQAKARATPPAKPANPIIISPKPAAPPVPADRAPSSPSPRESAPASEVVPREAPKEKESAPPPTFEPHLSMGNEAESGSFLSRIPLLVKIGAAIVLLTVAGYFVFGKSDTTAGGGANRAVAVGEQGWSTEWASDAAGSRRGRQLTLYRPSVGMSDYQFQFVGQIESKALGWIFREADTKNYYGMKIENIRPGAMAISHFAVVEGRESSDSQKPVGIDARPGAAYHVKLDVSGPRFTLYIEGEPVDFWTDNRLKAGAVGFMNERDERGATSSVQFSFAKGAK